MKKVIVLTTSTGQGHNQAAKSLIDLLQKNNYKCIKYDFLSDSSKFLKDIIINGYTLSAMSFPGIYGLLYKVTNNRLTNILIDIPFLFIKKRLYDLIKLEKPDLIISTHPLGVGIMNKLKNQGLDIPFLCVVTDFKAHYSYISNNVDIYITGSNYTKKSLMDKNIEENKIYPLGIPIKDSFFDRDENIPHIKNKEYFNILLMSGSMGLKDISYVLDELLKNKHKLRITVVCGNNTSLKESLMVHCNEDYKDKKLHILGFSNDIASFMEYSDVIISKPGGLTVTESIAKNLPLIIPFAIPGQEKENTEFLTKEGYALSTDNIKEINPLIDSLIEDSSILENMKHKLENLSNTYSSASIVDIVDDLTYKKNNTKVI